MESADFVGLRDATHSFGEKATVDHRSLNLFCNVFKSSGYIAEFCGPHFYYPLAGPPFCYLGRGAFF